MKTKTIRNLMIEFKNKQKDKGTADETLKTEMCISSKSPIKLSLIYEVLPFRLALPYSVFFCGSQISRFRPKKVVFNFSGNLFSRYLDVLCWDSIQFKF